jgi:hypothetical protein
MSDPRGRLVSALARAIVEAIAIGDRETARVAHEALGKLLDVPMAGARVPEMDQDFERKHE